MERYDNQPYGLAWELIVKNFYPESHPYSWPTIGFLNDIESYTIDDVKNFFQTYYSPSNATLVIAGDIKEDETIQLVEKYFGSIPSTSNNRKIIHFQEIKLNEVMQLLEGSIAPVDCVNDPDVCPRSGACATRDIWDEMKKAMNGVLESTTLQDLAERQKRKDNKDEAMYYI